MFTMDERHITKNLGIYSEPGGYQIVLNSAIYVLLYMRSFLSIDEVKIRHILSVLIVAIITCQSTTGYLGLGVLLIGHLFTKQREAISQRRKIRLTIFIVTILLGVDYLFNGQESLIGSVVLSKIFGNGNILDLSGSTGIYRIGSIVASVTCMVQNPLGVGYDNINRIVQNNFAGSAGAILMITGAALGVTALLVFIGWTISPILRSENISKVAKVVFILIWMNTALAQSEEIYTGIIFIPMILTEIDRCYKSTLYERALKGEQVC